MVRALERALSRVPGHGLAAVAVHESHRIACLAADFERATARACMMLLTCSDLSHAASRRWADSTPDPIAIGMPTESHPIPIDMSASIGIQAVRLPGSGAARASATPPRPASAGMPAS